MVLYATLKVQRCVGKNVVPKTTKLYADFGPISRSKFFIRIQLLFNTSEYSSRNEFSKAIQFNYIKSFCEIVIVVTF